MERDHGVNRTYPGKAISGLLAMMLVSGCVFGPDDTGRIPVPDRVQAVELKAIPPEQARAFLAELGFVDISILPDTDTLALAGSPSEQRKARVVLNLIDTKDEYATRAGQDAGFSSALISQGRYNSGRGSGFLRPFWGAGSVLGV